MQFEFATATRIQFGAGVSRQCAELARPLGRCALVVTGHNRSRAAGILNALQARGMELIFFAVSAEPDLATIEQGITLARGGNCEFILAIGGGSVLDTGKAIAAMVANSGPLLDFLEVIGEGKP